MVAKGNGGESITTKGSTSFRGDGTVLYPDYVGGYVNLHVLKLVELYTKIKIERQKERSHLCWNSSGSDSTRKKDFTWRRVVLGPILADPAFLLSKPVRQSPASSFNLAR